MKSQVIAIMAVMLVLSLATAVPTMITSTSAQLSSPPSSSQQSTAVDSNRIFESEGYGFRLQIPQGWVAQDTSEEEPQLGLRDSEDIEAFYRIRRNIQ